VLRPPSLQKPYDFISAADDALAVPVDGADEKANAAARADFAHRLDVARRTGDYSAVMLEGKQPAKFVLRPLPGSIVRKLFDDAAAGRVGNLEMAALAFRAALDGATALDGVTMRFVEDDRYGRIAAASVVDAIDSGCGASVINEVGLYAIQRAQQIDPKM